MTRHGTRPRPSSPARRAVGRLGPLPPLLPPGRAALLGPARGSGPHPFPRARSRPRRRPPPLTSGRRRPVGPFGGFASRLRVTLGVALLSLLPWALPRQNPHLAWLARARPPPRAAPFFCVLPTTVGADRGLCRRRQKQLVLDLLAECGSQVSPPDPRLLPPAEASGHCPVLMAYHSDPGGGAASPFASQRFGGQHRIADLDVTSRFGGCAGGWRHPVRCTNPSRLLLAFTAIRESHPVRWCPSFPLHACRSAGVMSRV